METVEENIERSRVARSSAFLFAAVVAVVAIAIFGVGMFVNQDGTAHLHSSSIMLKQLASGPTGPFVINPVPVPNSAGHWLQVLLLTGFSAFATTKLTLVLVYAGFVVSVVLLRIAASGMQGLNTSILFAAVIGLNWLWMLGTYSFFISTALMFGVLALFIRWQAELNIRR